MNVCINKIDQYIYTDLDCVCDGWCLECDGGCAEEDGGKTESLSSHESTNPVASQQHHQCHDN
jgi:hypothetical protein